METASSIGGESPKPPPKLLFCCQFIFLTELYWDLHIAAIPSVSFTNALSVNGILVTRNYRDFSQIPNLVLENWTM